MQPKWLFVQSKQREHYKKWTQDSITETLKLLQTHSLKDLAKRLGTSPGSISSALRRHNISVRYTRMAINASERESKRLKRTQAPLSQTDCSAAIRAITQLSAYRCKWPIGDVDSPDFRFCNAGRIIGNYCAKHDAIAFEREAA